MTTPYPRPGAPAPNECRYWNCTEIISRNYILCSKHNSLYRLGQIDQCPGCNTFKAARYETCSYCYYQEHGADAPRPRRRPA